MPSAAAASSRAGGGQSGAPLAAGSGHGAGAALSCALGGGVVCAARRARTGLVSHGALWRRFASRFGCAPRRQQALEAQAASTPPSGRIWMRAEQQKEARSSESTLSTLVRRGAKRPGPRASTSIMIVLYSGAPATSKRRGWPSRKSIVPHTRTTMEDRWMYSILCTIDITCTRTNCARKSMQVAAHTSVHGL